MVKKRKSSESCEHPEAVFWSSHDSLLVEWCKRCGSLRTTTTAGHVTPWVSPRTRPRDFEEAATLREAIGLLTDVSAVLVRVGDFLANEP